MMFVMKLIKTRSISSPFQILLWILFSAAFTACQQTQPQLIKPEIVSIFERNAQSQVNDNVGIVFDGGGPTIDLKSFPDSLCGEWKAETSSIYTKADDKTVILGQGVITIIRIHNGSGRPGAYLEGYDEAKLDGMKKGWVELLDQFGEIYAVTHINYVLKAQSIKVYAAHKNRRTGKEESATIWITTSSACNIQENGLAFGITTPNGATFSVGAFKPGAPAYLDASAAQEIFANQLKPGSGSTKN